MKKSIYQYLLKISLGLIICFFVLTNFAFNYSYPKIDAIVDHNYPSDYFRSPLDIPLYLSGTFAELRPNHFHSGIDIKTLAQEGLPIYAVADGYVSRVRIQSVGFGNSLYITHPNGLVSVYAHLQKYNPSIKKFAKDIQYAKKVFEIDTILTADLIPVKKGDIIALSGNSGGSAGPHLHFEIRDAVTEEPINPLLCGFAVADEVAPFIQAVSIYPLDENSSVNNLKQKVRMPATGKRPYYSLNNDNIINAWGKIGLGIECIDLQSGSSNQNGVYSIELKKNGERIYFSKMERFYFKDTKAINSHCDFKERNYSGRWIQKSFVDQGNPLTIYKDLDDRGRITLDPGDIYNMEYIVKDVKGNTATMKFVINCVNQNPYTFIFKNNRKSENFWGFQDKNILEKQNFKAVFNPNTFYDSIILNYANTKGSISAFSSIHSIGNKDIAINDFFEIQIKPERFMTDYQKSKTLIVQQGRGSVGGYFDNGIVKAKSKTVGGFYIGADSIPPSIKPVNIANGKNLKAASKILCKISDNLSGIKSFNAYIDDEWVLMDYDQKYALLSYQFDEKCTSGKHVFRLIVVDQKNNTSQYFATFYK